LEAEGLIETKVHKGAFVSSISPDEVMELFELRALIECDLLLHAIPKMTEADFIACQEILGELERVYTEREMARWGSLNAAFHRRLLSPAERGQSILILGGINLQVERFVRLQLLLTEAFETAALEHQQLLVLCRARDVEQAIPYLRDHILTAGRELVAAMKSKRKF
jgi:DNA-binding GntR family transcriptional regulator